MLKFEEYLADFTNSVQLLDFIISLLVATLLSILIKFFYIRYGQSFSNKEKFASIFVPLALGTLLIITVVQASIALSLGLVGALSIVRFRAAIKEPEELTYLFLIIGVGITCGANKPILAIIAILFILLLLFITQNYGSKKTISKDRKLIHIRTSGAKVLDITNTLKPLVGYLEMRRMEENKDGLVLTYVAQIENVEGVQKIQDSLKALSPDLSFTLVDQPELVL